MRSILPMLAATLGAVAFAAAPASAAQTFTNETPINIPGKGKASPYPSRIAVSGMPGHITDVTISLRGVSHSDPSDLDILLVAPDGEHSIVFSDACFAPDAPDIVNATWIFKQSAPAPAPQFERCDGPFYRPTDYIANDEWPDAPPGPYSADFNRFIGGDPNGMWSLYVYQGGEVDHGRVALGWMLSIDSAVPDVVVPGDPVTFGGQANPYPATRRISGVEGVITDLDVSLAGVFHKQPVDLDVLLAGPQGQRVMLMSDACGQEPIYGATWSWSDEVGRGMLDDQSCQSSSYNPTNWGGNDALPGVDGAYGSRLSDFDFTDPNGEWRMYIYDDQFLVKHGFVKQRFDLHMTTRPRATVEFAADAADVLEGQTARLTVTRSAGGQPVGPGSVTVTTSPRTATSGTDYQPVSTKVEFAPGETQKTVALPALIDETTDSPETLALTIGGETGDAQLGARKTTVVTIRDRPATSAGGGDGATTVDRIAPSIRGVRVRRRTLRYSLSEPASVTLRFERVAGTRRSKARRLRRQGRAGLNRVALGRRALRRGSYRLVVTATDAAGNRASSRPRAFRIAR